MNRYPLKSEGIEYLETRQSCDSYRFNENTKRSDIENLINLLPEDKELWFFDLDYPQISDPGGYFSIGKEANQFLVMVGNHGWSSYWKRETKDRLKDYLWGCVGFNKDKVFNNIGIVTHSGNSRQIEDNPNSQFSKQFEERLNQIKAQQNDEGNWI